MPRIIAGQYKSLKLTSPKNLKTRPTADRLKEAMFSILDSVFKNLNLTFSDFKVLDLFAGSGSLGLEAYSRGATSCLLSDFSEEAIKALKKNIDFLKIEDPKVKILKAHWPQDIHKLKNRQFNLIFLDPPYEEYELIIKLLYLMQKANLFCENCFVVWETTVENLKKIEKEQLANWRDNRKKNYKWARVSYFKCFNCYYFLLRFQPKDKF